MTERSATGGRDVHTLRFPAAPPPATVAILVVGAGPVGLAAAVEPFTIAHLTDPAARAVSGTTNVLIRPDQHVAWRGGRLPGVGAGAVLDTVLGRVGAAAARTPAPVTAAVRSPGTWTRTRRCAASTPSPAVPRTSSRRWGRRRRAARRDGPDHPVHPRRPRPRRRDPCP
ncbi:hypothetical protein ACFXDH_35740 [Streptomyces sp. NPDC059467]|uniref:aromatic-ring hydroxylase C-terminal domain-containing protein n=1 Tax=Streptomyces sp. NPDC059467 TaxID=3346844 RepID=UPI0036798886